jgi:hypothetical protein
MHFGHVDIFRGDAGLLVGLLCGEMRDDLVRLIDVACAARLHHARQYTHRAAGGPVQAFQTVAVGKLLKKDVRAKFWGAMALNLMLTE